MHLKTGVVLADDLQLSSSERDARTGSDGVVGGGVGISGTGVGDTGESQL